MANVEALEVMTKNINQLEKYLTAQGWLKDAEIITGVEIPGSGNMNFTLRILTDRGSFIIKQSRGYVEKYPQVSAPADRVLREAEFYTLTAHDKYLKSKMPQLLGVDRKNYVLKLEDLGEGIDYSFLYNRNNFLSLGQLEEIMLFAAILHTGQFCEQSDKKLTNRAMRKLNHEHIFLYPFLTGNGLDLDGILPGLQKVGDAFKEDRALKTRVQELGEKYLSDGPVLLHGDYFPGSWLMTTNGLKVIDPEFCFFGTPEFEVGVTLAHLKMAGESWDFIDQAVYFYMEKAPLQKETCFEYMAVEIMRRILGLAQLPLDLDIFERENLLKEARAILI